MLGHQGRVGEAEHGWRVVEHDVELVGFGQLGHQLVHALGAEQAGGVGWAGTGRDHAPVVVALHRLQHITPIQIGFGEQVAEAGEVVEAEAVVQLWFAHVGIHQQHPLTHFREGFGQQGIHQGFAFCRQGAGEGQGAQGLVAAEEADAGEEVAEGFLVEETLVAR